MTKAVKTMRISKTTINMAARRGLALVVREHDDCVTQDMLRHSDGDTISTVEISAVCDGEPADEYAALYRITSTGLFFLNALTTDSEDWPYCIPDDASLRALLPAMAAAV